MESKKSQEFFGKFFSRYLMVILIIGSFGLGMLFGRSTDQSITKPAEGGEVTGKDTIPEYLTKDVDFDVFWDAWELIQEHYVDQPINETQMLYGALTGLTASVGDPHTVFFDPDTTESFQQELNGSFEGIGAEIAIKNNQLLIVSPLDGSPAKDAGIRSGDKIYAIDGQDTAGMSLDQAVSLIRGPKGTEVVLTISRDGLEDVQEIVIVRDTIDINSVELRFQDDVAVLELSYFHEDTLGDFNDAVKEIIEKNPKGIILDMRGNPGGFLDSAVAIASEWVEDGVIVYEKDSEERLTEHDAVGTARLAGYPTVVLINGGSASGSEIVAGALQDYGIAQVLGEQSFGKGSVQTLIPLDDGSSIKITIAKWLTPNKNTIEEQGITPEIEVELTEEDFNNDRDPQLDRALELLQ